MKNKNQTNMKAIITIVIAFVMLIPSAMTISAQETSPLTVTLEGPYTVDIGVNLRPSYTISGGVPPYSGMWQWGDGSGGNYGYHAWGGNAPAVYNIAFEVKDSVGTISVGSTRVYTRLPTDNNIFIDGYVKHQGESSWKKAINANVGDVLNEKFVLTTIGSSPLKVILGNENTIEFMYIEDSINIPPTEYYPGDGENNGPAFYWEFNSVEPNSVIEITYDVVVIRDQSKYASYEGVAGSGAEVYAFLSETTFGGPSGQVATDMDGFGVLITKTTGKTLYVDDNGPAQFRHIQDAINAAEDKDIILVKPGVYPETLVVDKSVQLVGSGMSSTIIDGQYKPINNATVTIQADRVTMSGFTVRNSVCGLIVESNDNVIKRNKVINSNSIGIFLSGSNCLIKDNTIQSNAEGLLVYDGYINGGYNLIKGNLFTQNSKYGLKVESWANDVNENTFKKNGINAIDDSKSLLSNQWTGYSVFEGRFKGNFWDDYNGPDSDGDGLGDSPYSSTVGGQGLVLDMYPIMK